jgi:hypothetical protein
MVDISELAKQVGCVVELAFSDGQVVRAKLQAVDVEQSEIMYKIIELVSSGSAPVSNATPGSAVVADPKYLATFTRLE